MNRCTRRQSLVTRSRIRRHQHRKICTALVIALYPLRLAPERTNLARADKIETMVSAVSSTYGSRRSSIPTMKMAPPVLKERKAFQAFLQRVKVYSKYYGFESVLQSEPHLDVGSIQRNILINQGVSAETYERHLRAWVFFSQAFELPADVGRFQRSTSPGGFWEATLKWYLPQTAGQQITLRRQLTNFQVPKGSDPEQKYLEIEDHAELMRDAQFKPMCNRFTVSTSLTFPPTTNSKFESSIGIRSRIAMRLSTRCRPSTTYLARKTRALHQPIIRLALLFEI